MSSMIDTVEARQRITTDHALLRSLTRALIALSRGATEGDDSQRPVICDVLRQLCSELDRHFQFEQEAILPLMREMDAWGPVRVEQLCKLHEEQRAVLMALADGAADEARNIDDVAEDIVCFFRRFEEEMENEEQRLLEAEVIGAEPSVDQIDG